MWPVLLLEPELGFLSLCGFGQESTLFDVLDVSV